MSCLPHTRQCRRPRLRALCGGHQLPALLDKLPEKTRRSAIDRQKQIELAKARNLPHPIGFNYKQTPSEA